MALFLSSRACRRPTIAKLAQFFTTASSNGPKVAVVLAGSGVFDGSEIHEASACLVHLTRGGAEPRMFAPDVTQMHVVNHASGQPSTGETRNVLVESARIARGRVRPLGELSAATVDAVVFPGGFGAAKNLSNFATDGAKCKIIPDVERVLKEFHAAKKPMAFCCIAPTLVARVIPKVEITFGHDKDDGSGHWPYAGTVEAAKQWGAIHHNTDVHGVVVDRVNLVVSTPAFMYETLNFHEIYDGIGKMIKELLHLIKK